MLVYPIERRSQNFIEKIALRPYVRLPFFDTVSGKWTVSRRIDPNFRESIISRASGSVNRHRQIASVLIASVRAQTGKRLRSLKQLSEAHPQIQIYNTETSGPIHNALLPLRNYVSSDFFDSAVKSGETINGKRHEDLMNLSFSDNAFDFVISGDVFEHIPDPYRAHREVLRVLRSGGRHIFTVPFYQTEYLDERRAHLDQNGEVIHELEPIYHYDPLRPNDGVLVYNIFALEMLTQLKRIGFETRMHSLYDPLAGILGNNSIVFEAIKPT